MLAEIEIRQDVVDCDGKRRTGFVEVYVDVTNNYEWNSIDADAFQYFRIRSEIRQLGYGSQADR